MPKVLAENMLASGMQVEAGLVDDAQKAQEDFDSFLARAQAQPSDEEAREALMSLMTQAVDNGDVDFVMRNAMVLAATACTDPHLEETANEAGKLVNDIFDRRDQPDGHGDNGEHETDPVTGRRKKKKKHVYDSLVQLMLKHSAYRPLSC